MAINLNDNIKVLAGKPTDARYLNNLTPYATVLEANTAIGPTLRYIGLTVNVAGIEYWYGTGILNTDLVIKDSGIASTGLTQAYNGLTKQGNTVVLGGNLTGNTSVTPVGSNYLQLGTATNYAYMGTGSTSMNAQSGTHYSNVGVSKCYAAITANDTLIGFPTTIGQVSTCSVLGQVSILAGNFTNGCATGIGLTPSGITVCSATPTNFAGMKYVANYGTNFTARSIPDAAWVTGRTSTSGIQTASNGLTKQGTNVVLGGTITGATILTDSRGTPSGITYGGDYSANFGLNSIPDWRSIVTVAPLTQTGAFSLTLPMLGKSVIVTSATPVNVTIPLNSSVAFPIGSIITIQQGGAGIVTAVGASGVTVNGVVLSTTKQYAFVQYWKTATDTWSVIGGAIELWQTSGSSLIVPVDLDKRVPVQFISGLTSALGGFISGATNGLTKVGQNVRLGGALTGSTTISIPSGYVYKVSGDSTTTIDSCATNVNSIATNNVDLQAGPGSQKTEIALFGNLDKIILTTSGSTSTGAGIVVDGDVSNPRICTLGKMFVCTTPTVGSTDNVVLVRDTATGEVNTLTLGTITGATSLTANNGLTKIDNNLVLGGNLTGNTCIDINGKQLQICDSSFANAYSYFTASDIWFGISGGSYMRVGDYPAGDIIDLYTCDGPEICLNGGTNAICICGASGFKGAQYKTDYSANYVALSIPDVGFVTGLTSGIDTRLDVIEPIYVSGATNGLSKADCHNVKLGGQLCETTLIYGSQELNFNVDKLRLSGVTSGVDIGGTVSLKTSPSGSGGLLCIDAISGQICQTSLSAFGGITGGTNGITDCGSQRLGLGGVLCACTSLYGACLDIKGVSGLNIRTTGNTDMNIDAQSNGGFAIKSQTGTTNTYADFTGAVGIFGHVESPNGFAIYDNRPSTGQTGIVYAGNYALNYVNRSLVDKEYVDSIATGLNVHPAVNVATTNTGAITLSGTPVIDGIQTVVGWRILVKNQNGLSGATTNGIYNISSGTWSRAVDYDGSPSGEVSNGDLIPVTTGNTQNNSLWAMVTLNPITVGTTPLVFSQFATIIDVVAGQGIAITMTGGQHEVCVNLGTGTQSGCGLAVNASGLCIDSNIAGNGLAYSAGVLNVNAANCGSVPAIPVGYNASDCLVVACSDLRNAVSAITGATNGLTSSSCVVKLGGTLCEVTTITGNFAAGCGLTYTDAAITNKRGIQYGGDYSSTYIARSLVDAGYVTGLTSGIDSRLDVIEADYITGATEGLSKVGAHDVSLGGTLASGTTIWLCNTALYRTEGCNNLGSLLNLGSPNVSPQYIYAGLGYTESLSPTIGSNITFYSGLTILRAQSGSTSKAVCLDYSKALEYCNDYSADYTLRSLVDKEYVDNAVNSTTGITGNAITGATNGLCKYDNHNVCLGGTLLPNTITSVLHANTGNGTLQLGGYSPNPANWGGGKIQLERSSGTTSGNLVCIAAKGITGTGNESQINLNPTGITISGSYSEFKGAQYGSDAYRANFVCNSLVDAAYVTGLTSTSGIQKAGNGLSKSGDTVVLGGTLTGDTIIQLGTTNNLCITHNDTYSDEVSFRILSTNDNIYMGSKSVTTGDEATFIVDATQFEANSEDPTTFKGFTYCGGFNATVGDKQSCSIPDLGYVTGLTSQGITSAGNGLSKSGNTVVLGGSLTGSTSIDTTTAYQIQIGDISTQNAYLNLDPIVYCAEMCANSGGINVGFIAAADDSYGLIHAIDTLDASDICIQPTQINLNTTDGTNNTDITISSEAIIVNSPAPAFVGVQYAADYSANFIARSLVDAAYVTGQTSSGITTASNGLTKVGQTVALGGPLTGATYINLQGSEFSLYETTDTYRMLRVDESADIVELSDTTGVMKIGLYGGISDCIALTTIGGGGLNISGGNDCVQLANNTDAHLHINGDGILIATSNSDNGIHIDGVLGSVNISGNTWVNVSAGPTHFEYVQVNAGVGVEIGANDGTTTINVDDDGLGNSNIALRATAVCLTEVPPTGDGSEDVLLRNSVTDEVVIIPLSTITGATAYNYTNGLTKLDSDVCLGGTLIAPTTVLTDGNIFTVCGTLNGWGLLIDDDNEQVCIGSSLKSIYSSSAINLVCQDDGATTFSEFRQTTASNELCSTDGTDDTLIHQSPTLICSQLTGGLTFAALNNGDNSFCVQVGDGINPNMDFFLNRTSDAIQLSNSGGEGLILNGTTGEVRLYGISTEISLSGSCITTTGYVKLSTTPNPGLTTDSVLVWNSSDKQIKTVNGASLGDKNNIYAMTVVTSNVTLTTGSTYVQLVNNVSSGLTVTLPSTPINGQVFRIKDAAGYAVTRNITVARNGKLIDSATNDASINTDFGALELVYNNALGSWYVFSFVN